MVRYFFQSSQRSSKRQLPETTCLTNNIWWPLWNMERETISCSIKEMAHEAFWTCCPFLVVNFSSKFRWFHPSDSPTGQALLSLSFLRGPFGNLLTANEAAPGLGWRYNSHCVTPLLWPRRCVLMFALQAAYPAASSQPRTNVGKQLLCLQPLSSFHFHPEVINFHFSGKKRTTEPK